MNSKEDLIRSRLRRYKQRFADAVLLLRIRGLYYAICEDAALVADLSGRRRRYSRGVAHVPYCELSEDHLPGTISALRRAGYCVAVIDRVTGAARVCYGGADHCCERGRNADTLPCSQQPPAVGRFEESVDDVVSLPPNAIENDGVGKQTFPVSPVVKDISSCEDFGPLQIVPPERPELNRAHTMRQKRIYRALVTLLAPVALLLAAIGAVWWLLPIHGRTMGTPPVEQQAVSEMVPVAYRELVREIHLNGVLSYSPGQETHVAAPISGRVDSVAARSAGDYVTRGERLFSIYSEGLFAAHQKLLTALNAERTPPGSDRAFATSQADSLFAAREDLLLLGVPPNELDALEHVRAPTGLLPIRTTASSVLLDMSITDGSEVKRGERLCRLVEPDPMWLFLRVPVEDLSWVMAGRRAKVIVEGEPPMEISAMVTVVSPAVNGTTRTAKIGIPLPNPHQDLKPGMPAEAILRGVICADGMPESTPMEGKFICVRHPDIVQNVPGQCPKTGNLLARCPVEHHMHQMALGRKVAAIPATAVLDLDGRKIVYRLRGHGAAQMAAVVEIQIGLSASGCDSHGNPTEYVPVISGLKLGNRVLTPIRRFVKRHGLRGRNPPPDPLLQRANKLWESVACAFSTPIAGVADTCDFRQRPLRLLYGNSLDSRFLHEAAAAQSRRTDVLWPERG